MNVDNGGRACAAARTHARARTAYCNACAACAARVCGSVHRVRQNSAQQRPRRAHAERDAPVFASRAIDR